MQGPGGPDGDPGFEHGGKTYEFFAAHWPDSEQSLQAGQDRLPSATD
jgi:hypothetical protein